MNPTNKGLIAAGVLVLFAAAPSFAQLEEITVTAERRETTLQDTPLSVVAFSETRLEARSIDTIENLASFVPNLSVGGDVNGGAARPLFVIRGVGQNSGRDTIERGVGLYVDDIYLPRVTGNFLQLVDVERVEVLRGPQGTLFGRNSTGGAVRYVTRKPTRESEGYVRTTFGSYSRVDFDGLINMPLGDNAAIRLQAGSFRRDGFLEGTVHGNDRGDQDEYLLRGTVRWWVGDRATIDVGLNYQESKSFGPPLKGIVFSPTSIHGRSMDAQWQNMGQDPLVMNDPRLIESDHWKWADNCFVGVNNDGYAIDNGRNFFADQPSFCNFHVNDRNLFGHIDINVDLSDNMSLRAITGYTDGKADHNNDWTGVGSFGSNEVSDYDSFSQEVQISYDTERMNLVAGAIYFQEAPTLFNRTANVDPFFAGSGNGNCCWGFQRLRSADTESIGAFAQVSFNITDQLTAIGGLRYSKDDKSLEITRSDRVPGSNSDSWSSTDYRVTLQYEPSDAVMVYGTIATGFKSGGFNDSLVAGADNEGVAPYDPEDVLSWELGVRSSLIDNRLELNATYFSSNYDNIQLTAPRFLGGDTVGATLTIENAGEIDLDGIELDVRWQISDAFSIDAGLATLNQDVVNLLDGSALLIRATCDDPANLTFDTCDSQPLARAPELSYFLAADLVTAMGGGEATWSAAYSWTDEMYANNAADSSFLADAYGIVNLRAEYRPADGNWSLALIGTNVTNEEYITMGIDFLRTGAFFPTTTVAPGRPREWGVRFRYDF